MFWERLALTFLWDKLFNLLHWLGNPEKDQVSSFVTPKGWVLTFKNSKFGFHVSLNVSPWILEKAGQACCQSSNVLKVKGVYPTLIRSATAQLTTKAIHENICSRLLMLSIVFIIFSQFNFLTKIMTRVAHHSVGEHIWMFFAWTKNCLHTWRLLGRQFGSTYEGHVLANLHVGNICSAVIAVTLHQGKWSNETKNQEHTCK